MRHHHNGLSFRTLREANKQRLPQFKNAKGELSHSKPDGSDWSLADWMTAVAGELGEAANVLKKLRRGDLTFEEARCLLADEFADVATYLDILAMQCGIDLGRAVQEKFNKVSERVGANVRIGDDDDWHQRWSTTKQLSPADLAHLQQSMDNADRVRAADRDPLTVANAVIPEVKMPDDSGIDLEVMQPSLSRHTRDSIGFDGRHDPPENKEDRPLLQGWNGHESTWEERMRHRVVIDFQFSKTAANKLTLDELRQCEKMLALRNEGKILEAGE